MLHATHPPSAPPPRPYVHFYAQKGQDYILTDYDDMALILDDLVTVACPTAMPTAPSKAPTYGPTANPSGAPTVVPSASPTYSCVCNSTAMQCDSVNGYCYAEDAACSVMKCGCRGDGFKCANATSCTGAGACTAAPTASPSTGEFALCTVTHFVRLLLTKFDSLLPRTSLTCNSVPHTGAHNCAADVGSTVCGAFRADSEPHILGPSRAQYYRYISSCESLSQLLI